MAAGEETLKLVLAAIDKTAAPIRAVNRRIEGMLAPVRKVANAFRSLAIEARLPQLGRALARVGRIARNVAAGAIAAGAGVLAFVLKTAQSADSLAKFTSLIGIGVEEFQELQFAAKRAGIDNEVFASGMRSLAVNVGRAQAGTGSFAALLKKVAPSVLQQIQGATDTGEALEIVLAAMRKLPDAMKRNELASKAFGNSTAALLATLSPAEINAFREEARKLGIVLSGDAARAAETLQDNIDDLKASTLGLARSIAASLFPDLQRATDQMLEWIKAHKDLILTDSKKFIRDFAEGVRQTAIWLTVTMPKISKTVEELGGMKTVLIAIAAISLAPLLQTILAIGLALGGPVSAALALASALTYVLTHLKEVKAGMLSIAGAFGFDVGPSRPGDTLRAAAPGRSAHIQAQAVAAAERLDALLSVDINLSDRRAKVAKITSTHPSVQFGNLSTGVALGSQ